MCYVVNLLFQPPQVVGRRADEHPPRVPGETAKHRLPGAQPEPLLPRLVENGRLGGGRFERVGSAAWPKKTLVGGAPRAASPCTLAMPASEKVKTLSRPE